MIDLLQKVILPLSNYLGMILPVLFENWWTEAVIEKLSYFQQARIKQRQIQSLEELDLAALLRVLDQNWHRISEEKGLTTEDRHFVKEMQTIRNRWAHKGSNEFSTDDIYRDLDTLQRFAMVIEVGDIFIQKVREKKASLLTDRIKTVLNIPSNDERQILQKETQKTEFDPGQIVVLKSNPEIKGAVVSIMPGKPENRYKVFIDGETRIFYASQIQTEERENRDSIILPCHKFNSYLTALQIQHPGLSTLYSLNAARVDFIPYQFRPVLKFIRSDRPRLLIADGVGVGKTIEAGLILRELQARRDVRSVLIICPRPLVTERKWQMEMKRFEERFAHLDGRTIRFCVNETDLEGAWPEQYQKAIIPYSLFDEALLYGKSPDGRRRRKKGLLDLDPPPRFDLVIVDEAHHIRN
ncbi:MAG: Swt1 family HEPN domain-containing protein, partial [Fidelibacterota bacterium]